LDKTGHVITQYSVERAKASDEDNTWVFFIEGQGKFERPGYHWIVKIDKKTGVAKL
jgi:hypothetical protein